MTSSPPASFSPPIISKRAAPASSPTPNHTQTRNPISLRLYKVLGASFDDEPTREALRTLSDLYDVPTPSSVKPSLSLHGKGKSKQAIVDDDIDSEEEEETSTGPKETNFSLGPFLSDDIAVSSGAAAHARKNLRRNIETKLTGSSRQFLRALGEVDQKLDTLQEHIVAMRTQCDEAGTQLRSTNESCKSLLDQAGNLRQERDAVSAQQTVLDLFLSRFTLTPDELTALTSRDVPPGKRFFAAMDKAKSIMEDCRVLMGVGGEQGPTKAGLDIVASTSSHLEQAYEKIYRYLSAEFQQVGRGDRDRERSVDPDANLEVSPTMRESVRRLRDRSELLAEALAALSRTRQSALLATFLDALTRGGPSGLPRPIELHAHDPLRYIGDMLAWVHQAIAAEREFLESLFGFGVNDGADGEGNEDRRMIGSVRRFEKGRMGEVEEWIGEVMDKNVGKLCGPLKVRVQQTVRSQESPIVSYKVSNLLHFYMLTMSRTIGQEAALSQALKEMTEVSYKVFFDAIEAQGRALLRVTIDTHDPSLAPPWPIRDHSQTLRDILTVYESSRLDEPEVEVRTPDGLQEPKTRLQPQFGVERILDVMIEPAVEMCITAAEEKTRTSPGWDRPVFVLNCLTYLQSILEPFSFTAEKRRMIEAKVEERVNQLMDEHYHNILQDAGLNEVALACETKAPSEPLSHLEATEPQQLSNALQKFSSWLSGLEVVHSPRLSQLMVQRLHNKIHQAALERLAQTYQKICEEVKKPESKYEAASTLLGSQRPFGQIHLLRQIFGLQDE